MDLIGLGRRVAKDERDRDYLMARRPEAAGVTRRHWYSPGILDQGSTSQCVAYAGTKYLTSGPVTNKPPMLPGALYHQCQLRDEWPGENYDGTSVRALLKVLKDAGLIERYEWAFSADRVIEHLLTVGPVILGTEWTYGMFQADRWGYIQPEGRSAGGHAYLATGADRTKIHPLSKKTGAARCPNSWGRTWGPHGGRFWLAFEHMDALIRDNGEAAIAWEKRRA